MSDNSLPLFTSAIEPEPQKSQTSFEFSKECLIESKITLKDIVDFARQEKQESLNPEDGLKKLNLEDEGVVKATNGIITFEQDGFEGHIKWWAFYPCEGGDKPPIIAMHGGPSFTHKYMLPLKLMAYPEFGGYPVIFYDQCGCGGSTTIVSLKETSDKGNKDMKASSSVNSEPDETPPHLFTVQYYVEEFVHLLRTWNTSKDNPISFKNGYYLYGSSWGTILAQEVAVYLRMKMDQNSTLSQSSLNELPMLLGMFLDGALSDAQLYCKSQWKYRISRMPGFTYHLLKKLDGLGSEKEMKDANAKKDTENLPEATDWYQTKTYKAIEQVLASMFTTRLVPLPDFWNECSKGANFEIYSKMQGCSEFTIGGCLKNWSIADRLPCLSKPTELEDGIVVKAPLPVLAIAGEFDTMTIECHQHVLDSIGGGRRNKLVVIPRAGHCKLVDEPLACCEEVLKFLQ